MIPEPRQLKVSFATATKEPSSPPASLLPSPSPSHSAMVHGQRSLAHPRHSYTGAAPLPGPRAGLGDDDGDGPRRRPRPTPPASRAGTPPGAAASRASASDAAALGITADVGHRSLPAGDRRVPAYRREGRRLRRLELLRRLGFVDVGGRPEARRVVFAVARLVHLDLYTSRRGDGESNLPSLGLMDGGVVRLGILGVSHRGGHVESELVHRLHHRRRRLGPEVVPRLLRACWGGIGVVSEWCEGATGGWRIGGSSVRGARG